MTMIGKANKLSKWLYENDLKKEAVELNDLIKTADLLDFENKHMKYVWDHLRSGYTPLVDTMWVYLYNIIRYSSYSSKALLSKQIVGSEAYNEWSPKVKVNPDKPVFSSEYWASMQQYSGVKSLMLNDSGHIQVNFNRPKSYDKNLTTYRLNQMTISQDLYFSFEVTKEVMMDSDLAIKAIESYLRWVQKVVEYCGGLNNRLEASGSQMFVNALKFRTGEDLYSEKTILSDRDTLKIYLKNFTSKNTKKLYDKVLSLKEGLSEFNINKSRTRTHRGFDLKNIPMPNKLGDDGASFGQILAHRVGFYLVQPSTLGMIRGLEDDAAGKERFSKLIQELVRDSQGELVEAMDEYAKCGTAAKINKIFKDIGINIV